MRPGCGQCWGISGIVVGVVWTARRLKDVATESCAKRPTCILVPEDGAGAEGVSAMWFALNHDLVADNDIARGFRITSVTWMAISGAAREE
jgi:hypothetical protein